MLPCAGAVATCANAPHIDWTSLIAVGRTMGILGSRLYELNTFAWRIGRTLERDE